MAKNTFVTTNENISDDNICYHNNISFLPKLCWHKISFTFSDKL